MSKTGCDVVASGAELSSSMSCNVTLVFVQEVADEKSCVMSKAVQWLTSRGKQSAKREAGQAVSRSWREKSWYFLTMPYLSTTYMYVARETC